MLKLLIEGVLVLAAVLGAGQGPAMAQWVSSQPALHVVLGPALALTLGLSVAGHLGLKPSEWTLLGVTGPGSSANLHLFPSTAESAQAKPQSNLLCWGVCDTPSSGEMDLLPIRLYFNQSYFGGSDC